MACLGLQSTSAGICSESLHGQDTRPYIRVASRDDDRRVQVLVVYYGDKKKKQKVSLSFLGAARVVYRVCTQVVSAIVGPAMFTPRPPFICRLLKKLRCRRRRPSANGALLILSPGVWNLVSSLLCYYYILLSASIRCKDILFFCSFITVATGGDRPEYMFFRCVIA